MYTSKKQMKNDEYRINFRIIDKNQIDHSLKHKKIFKLNERFFKKIYFGSWKVDSHAPRIFQIGRFPQPEPTKWNADPPVSEVRPKCTLSP